MALRMNALSTLGRSSITDLRFEPYRGAPLPDDVRRQAEELFGEDLSDVRIFISHDAPRMGALAFTHGNRIYFAPGQYDPRTERGLHLLGHELAHVVQQRRGRARNTFGYGVQVVKDEGLEREAEKMGRALQMMQANPQFITEEEAKNIIKSYYMNYLLSQFWDQHPGKKKLWESDVYWFITANVGPVQKGSGYFVTQWVRFRAFPILGVDKWKTVLNVLEFVGEKLSGLDLLFDALEVVEFVKGEARKPVWKEFQEGVARKLLDNPEMAKSLPHEYTVLDGLAALTYRAVRKSGKQHMLPVPQGLHVDPAYDLCVQSVDRKVEKGNSPVSNMLDAFIHRGLLPERPDPNGDTGWRLHGGAGSVLPNEAGYILLKDSDNGLVTVGNWSAVPLGSQGNMVVTADHHQFA